MNKVAPRFLTLDQVLRLHRDCLTKYGGSDGVRDMGLVESALASAKNTFFYGGGDVFDVAATYAFHLAEAQAFLDGNKRVGVSAALVLLHINGWLLSENPAILHRAMIDVANKTLNKPGLAELFRKSAKPRSEPSDTISL